METPDGGGRRCDGMKTGPSVPWPSILYLSLPATGIKGKEKEGIIGESLEWMINPLQMMDDGEQGREMDSWLRTFGSYHRSRSFFIFSFIFFCFYHVFLFSIHVGSPEIILEKRPNPFLFLCLSSLLRIWNARKRRDTERKGCEWGYERERKERAVEGRRWMGWRKGNCKDMTQPIISFPSLFPGFLHLPGHHIPFPFASLLSVGCCHRSYWRGDKGSTQHTNEGNERVREGKEWREVTAGNKWHDFPHPAPFPLPRKGIDRRATRRRRGKRREG